MDPTISANDMDNENDHYYYPYPLYEIEPFNSAHVNDNLKKYIADCK